jgi:D-3-phosphoglycerate dehydrogenase
MRKKILLLENIHSKAKKILETADFDIETLDTALAEKELINKVGEASVLGIRSKTNITEKVLTAAKNLDCVAAFCIGTNQIDINACTKKGVPVFNAPFSNTRSVAELAIGHIIMLLRRIPEKNINSHNGIWDKSANGCYEVRGKNLGIVGYGKIGSQLSILAENMGMNVYFFDVQEKLALGNAMPCKTLNELLQKCDIASVHVDGRKENKNLIGKKQIAAMRQGAALINSSRGFVVDIDALKEALAAKRLAGAAIDVFPKEPESKREKFVSPLQNLPNVILTPHIGGSTEEAQENIAEFVAKKIIDFWSAGSTEFSVNFPEIAGQANGRGARVLHIHKNVPGILAQINRIIAGRGINILGQHLKTNEQIGYAITDIDGIADEKTTEQLKMIPHTIKCRTI